MFNEKIQGVASKTLYGLEEQWSKKGFDFYKMMDVASSENENNFEEFDKYYYKKVVGEIRVGERRKVFSFEIPNYHRLIRYVVRIEVGDGQMVGEGRGNEGIAVEVSDRDYEMKLEYYRDWKDELEA